ncbi:hypothetical protein [Rubrolithibacter danxiaensis]|uniref:hypothetical protein n=1 Tax=Rubrolithibacter danxiaensis TaxID=3390805 RepID=UPI003BF8D795
MQVQIDIGFDELVSIAKKLSPTQWLKLKEEVDKEIRKDAPTELESFLLSAPTLNDEQFELIEQARKEIDEWR